MRSINKFFFVTILLPFFICEISNAQFFKRDFYDSTEVYFVNQYVSISIATAGLISNSLGLRRLSKLEPTSEAKILGLRKEDVNPIDQFAMRQDPSKTKQYAVASDNMLNIAVAMPVLLMFEKRVRKQWLDIFLMYTESHAINGNLYTHTPFGPTVTKRLRPEAYYDEFSLEARRSGRNRRSFFSGHVSTTAVGSFFTAKILHDLHPEWGGKRALLWIGASLPPIITGYYRVVSLNHFPTDTFIGALMGAASAIIVPTLHKKKQGKLNIGMAYHGEGGFSSSVIYKF